MKSSVAFINSTLPQCGVYQFGKGIFSCLVDSALYDFSYHELDNSIDYAEVVKDKDYVIVNYHFSTMGKWFTEKCIELKPNKTFVFCHDRFYTSPNAYTLYPN
ncbi:MAG: hypothetical protein SNJ71_08085, partial [Bacteroidales bacterium]